MCSCVCLYLPGGRRRKDKVRTSVCPHQIKRPSEPPGSPGERRHLPLDPCARGPALLPENHTLAAPRGGLWWPWRWSGERVGPRGPVFDSSGGSGDAGARPTPAPPPPEGAPWPRKGGGWTSDSRAWGTR